MMTQSFRHHLCRYKYKLIILIFFINFFKKFKRRLCGKIVFSISLPSSDNKNENQILSEKQIAPSPHPTQSIITYHEIPTTKAATQ